MNLICGFTGLIVAFGLIIASGFFPGSTNKDVKMMDMGIGVLLVSLVLIAWQPTGKKS